MLQMEMGGSERLVYNLARDLDRNLFNPSVAWFFGDRVLKEFQDLNIPLYHIPKTKRIDLRTMYNLGMVISKNNIHVVNSHHFMPTVYSFYGSKIRDLASLIYTEHSEWEIEQIPWKWKIIGQYLVGRTDAAVGVSDPVSRRIKENFKTEHSKIYTIRNGVCLDNFTNIYGRTPLRARMGLSPHDIAIGIVANFRRVKNHIFLLRAFSELIKDNVNAKLLLIGQGFEFDSENSEQELRNFVNKKNLSKNVLFLGYRSDIPDLLNAMDIFCLTSLKEGLPISLIEAMASGLPVVGTDVEGIRDVIVPDRNGILVEVGDVIGLRNALNTLIREKDLMQKYGEESKNLATSRYSLTRCTKQYEDLFISTTESRL